VRGTYSNGWVTCFSFCYSKKEDIKTMRKKIHIKAGTLILHNSFRLFAIAGTQTTNYLVFRTGYLVRILYSSLSRIYCLTTDSTLLRLPRRSHAGSWKSEHSLFPPARAEVIQEAGIRNSLCVKKSSLLIYHLGV
jgi:hypothetical protein